ncbi:RNA polymerase sigma factor [Macrococcus sp. EM39E]|uniref:RNA polymerase sigma factor n=1 Tax=Macrococcus animalis TaxID=3395467 RepID=UPI0039BDC1EF
MNENQIYVEYREFIYKFPLKYLKNRDLAEEITQETFYQALKSLRYFDPNKNTKFSSWLCQIALNLAKQSLQKNTRQNNLVDKLSNNLETTSIDLEASYLIKEQLGDLYTSIGKLKALEKEVVLLRIEKELSFHEIAVIYGKTENWARVTYFRAKQKLIEVKQNES